MPVTVAPVVAVTLRVEIAANADTVMFTSASTALITLFEFTVTPGPKVNVVVAPKFVAIPITLTKDVDPCGRVGGLTN